VRHVLRNSHAFTNSRYIALTWQLPALSDYLIAMESDVATATAQVLADVKK